MSRHCSYRSLSSPGSAVSAIDRLKRLRHDFLQACREGTPGILASRTYAQRVKEILQETVESLGVLGNRWALVAVGGFGRGELSFFSDLDLLFLHSRRFPKELYGVVYHLLYGLWDADFEVGHVTASASRIRSLMQSDFSVETTCLEAQFIAGDRELFSRWRSSIVESYGYRRRRKFLEKLKNYRHARLACYGESIYLLEPHVKEGIGALRDIHTLRWLGMVFLRTERLEAICEKGWMSSEELNWIKQAHDFLWRVRLQLHQLNNKRQDQLILEDQKRISTLLGFTDSKTNSAVESFMRYYYRCTARVRRVISLFMERALEASSRRIERIPMRRILPGPLLLEGPHIRFLEPELIPQNPSVLMSLFWYAAKLGAHFHHHMGHVIRSNLVYFDEKLREDPKVASQFFDILLNPKHAFRVLKAMMETGFLERLIPEFSAIRYRAQYDFYHLYTVDEHLLRTVKEMHRIPTLEEDGSRVVRDLKQIFEDVGDNRRVLFLAALVHDVGKGLGKNHSERGAPMARVIGSRFGLDPDELELLEFLVLNHLLLTETALKRDLSEEKPVVECALGIKDRTRLRLLYLLTVADSMATGPRAWNEWKSSLLHELYIKLDHILAEDGWKPAEVEVTKTRAEVLRLLKDRDDPKIIETWLDSLSFRYLVSQNPEAIARHYFVEKELNSSPLAMVTRSTVGKMWEITIATYDRPGLFATICGTLWTHGLNILAADIYTRRNGIALDILIVEQIPDELHKEELWESIHNDLRRAIPDQNYIEQLAKWKRRGSLLVPRDIPVRDDKVIIDEHASDFYTVVEVYTWDRPGVLFAIANCLYRLGISIKLAKISTPGAQVADVFYVTDLDGNKLMDEELHNVVKDRLLSCLRSW